MHKRDKTNVTLNPHRQAIQRHIRNTKYEIVKQVQPMWLQVPLFRAGLLRTHLKMHSREKTNKCSVTLHPLRQISWRHIWKYTVEKNLRNAAGVIMHPRGRTVWRYTLKCTAQKCKTEKPLWLWIPLWTGDVKTLLKPKIKQCNKVKGKINSDSCYLPDVIVAHGVQLFEADQDARPLEVLQLI